jgi:hypothetical protein
MKTTLGLLLPLLLLAACGSEPTTRTSVTATATATDPETLVEAFVQFARDPSDGTFGDLPLADTVDLGLGSTIIKTVKSTELRQPEAWQLNVDLFRAYTGPFSAFDTLSRLDGYETTVGDHAHCASPSVPAPDGYEELNRISVQPQLGPQDSCLMWGTVDFFLLPGGDVAAITLDMWEP